MILGTVIGSIDSTINHRYFDGKKMMIVEKMKADGTLTGDYVIALARSVDSGIGDVVLVLDEGNSARQILDSSDAPVRTLIVGIVDEAG
jgi:ethanolamine utilization protein EutN